MNIDWSKAPESASHFDPATGLFYRLHAGAEWEFFVNASQGWCDSSDWQGRKEAPDRVIARPLPWAPGALPPVGTVCEYQCGYVEQPYRHAECTVIAHFICESGKTLAAFTYVAHDGVVQLGRGTPELFRPIRTAEQIAAEERKREIEEIRKVSCSVGAEHEYDFAIALYAAGYRKQVAN